MFKDNKNFIMVLSLFRKNLAIRNEHFTYDTEIASSFFF